MEVVGYFVRAKSAKNEQNFISKKRASENLIVSKGNKKSQEIDSCNWPFFVFLLARAVVHYMQCRDLFMRLMQKILAHFLTLNIASSTLIYTVISIYKNGICNLKLIIHLCTHSELFIFCTAEILSSKLLLFIRFVNHLVLPNGAHFKTACE